MHLIHLGGLRNPRSIPQPEPFTSLVKGSFSFPFPLPSLVAGLVALQLPACSQEDGLGRSTPGGCSLPVLDGRESSLCSYGHGGPASVGSRCEAARLSSALSPSQTRRMHPKSCSKKVVILHGFIIRAVGISG